MKILITENKRYQLAYKILDDILDGLTREDYDANKDKDSIISNHQILFEDKNGELVMVFQEMKNTLYVLRDAVSILKMFSFDDEELHRLIWRWFKDRIGVEAEDVYLVNDFI
jgi:hypothetical protein